MPRELTSMTVGSVNLRKNGGRWHARWQVNGKRYFRSLGVTNQRIAEKKARELSDLVEAGDYEVAQNLHSRKDRTFGEVCEEFFDHMAESGEWAPTTVDGNKSRKRRLVAHFGGVPIATITPKDIEGFLAKLVERDGVKISTRNRFLAFLKALFKLAVRWGYLHRNPAAEVKQLKETPKPTAYLTVNELSVVLEVLKKRGGLDLTPLDCAQFCS
jgi:hypothetical protein